MKFSDLEFVRTCYACPEQYDVHYDNELVGYVRLRHGYLYCDCPYIGGDTVYEAEIEGPYGGGIFPDEETRMEHLTNIGVAIVKWLEEYNTKNKQEV